MRLIKRKKRAEKQTKVSVYFICTLILIKASYIFWNKLNIYFYMNNTSLNCQEYSQKFFDSTRRPSEIQGNNKFNRFDYIYNNCKNYQKEALFKII